MMRWLHDNPIGMGLAALCAVLLMAMALMGVASLLPVGTSHDEELAEGGEEIPMLPELGESPPIDEFRVITDRPLFSESRLPQLEPEVEADPVVDAPVEEDIDAPDVELAGVIITPTLRMATLRKKNKKSLVAFEGRPIEDADFGSWQLSRVDAREVVLTSGGGEELLLELRVHNEKIAPPDRPVEAEESAIEDEELLEEQAVEGEERMTRAEEIRQRIAERREELRRQAEEEEQATEQSARPNYQQAIQAMIGRSRREQNDDSNEQ